MAHKPMDDSAWSTHSKLFVRPLMRHKAVFCLLAAANKDFALADVTVT